MPAPDALLLLSSHCAHCPAVLAALAALVKDGILGRLEIINLESRPDAAANYGVRSVPWVRIGPFELHGPRDREELAAWAARVDSPTGMADFLHLLLKEGGLDRAARLIQADPPRLAALLPIVANPDASLNVRIGAGALFESYAGSEALAGLVPALGKLAGHADPRVRADACHYLGLSASSLAIPHLNSRLKDGEAEVREIAADSLNLLAATAPTTDDSVCPTNHDAV